MISQISYKLRLCTYTIITLLSCNLKNSDKNVYKQNFEFCLRYDDDSIMTLKIGFQNKKLNILENLTGINTDSLNISEIAKARKFCDSAILDWGYFKYQTIIPSNDTNYFNTLFNESLIEWKEFLDDTNTCNYFYNYSKRIIGIDNGLIFTNTKTTIFAGGSGTMKDQNISCFKLRDFQGKKSSRSSAIDSLNLDSVLEYVYNVPKEELMLYSDISFQFTNNQINLVLKEVGPNGWVHYYKSPTVLNMNLSIYFIGFENFNKSSDLVFKCYDDTIHIELPKKIKSIISLK